MAFFQDSLLWVSSDVSRQEIYRLQRGRKPSPWPTEALRGLPASSQKRVSLWHRNHPLMYFPTYSFSLAPYLDLILLASILNGLKNSPGATSAHFQPSNIAPIPLLDQDGCLESWGTKAEPACWAAVAAAELPCHRSFPDPENWRGTFLFQEQVCRKGVLMPKY